MPYPRLRALLLAPALLLLLAPLHSQTLDDILRYSEVNPLGTARSLGTANSMAAIGADWTAAQGNPAALAQFRSSEVTATFGGLLRGTSNATIAFSDPSIDGDAGQFSDVDFRAALPQVALVLTRTPIASRWTQLNFGFGVSQTNRFEENIAFDGDTPGSVTDLFLEEANGFYVDPAFTVGELSSGQFPAALAYQAGVLIPSDETGSPEFYFTDYDDFRFGPEDPGPLVNKRGKIERRGFQSNFDFTVAGNFEDRLQIGATIGIVNSSYEELNRVVETDQTGVIPVFDRIDYRRTFSVEGTGVQGRVGASYRFSQAFRLGLAYHSPSLVNYTDNFSSSVDYRYTLDTGPTGDDATTTNADIIEYKIISPSQYRLSVGSVIGRSGFVSGELNYINYAGAKVRFGSEVEDGDMLEDDYDDFVADNLQSAVQVRAGGEVNIDPLQVRLGVEYLGAPLPSEKAAYGVSAGVGFRQNRLAIDLGYKLSLRPDRVYRPYTIESNATLPADEQFPQPEVTYTPTLSMFALTAGWKLTRVGR